MTNEKALAAWKQMRAEISEENHLFVGTINPEMVDLAISALSRDRWISVEERLPEVDEKVLTFARNKYDGSWFMDITSWTGVKNHDEYHFWGYGDSMKVTHWIPLPEPPKEET